MQTVEKGLAMPLHHVIVQAPAKVNLFLDITGIAKNGYHLLDTVMQAVSLYDLVLIEKNSVSEISVTCTQPDVPEDASNIAYQAAEAFFSAAGLHACGVSVHIYKRIPTQAGLGGGSADAAAVLLGLNRLFEAKLPESMLYKLALSLGADVPFALMGGCAWAKGVGEQLSPLQSKWGESFFLIAKPEQGIRTQDAYRRYDAMATVRHESSQSMRTLILDDSADGIGKEMFNVFEQAMQDNTTNLLKRVMLSCGASGAALSGSGSAVVGLFNLEKDAWDCKETLKKDGMGAFVARPVCEGAKIILEN